MKIGPRLKPAYAVARGERTPVGFIAAASLLISTFADVRVPIALFVVKMPSVDCRTSVAIEAGQHLIRSAAHPKRVR
jgi:hypothetical protein